IHLSICNTDPNTSTTLTCDLRGIHATSVTGQVLTADTITAHNTFDNPNTLYPANFNGATLNGTALSIDLPAKSVIVLKIT
ncbi:MAG: alpha-L-arabinofuranosidase C-terminal domain-containing protein, partial [Candidatus Latescibacteria bacterium]|nr:alpha-L-arabinofuranosidase C-terminal domain-containing protein [Candidatus Latescibacterota bacterium]